MLGVEGFATLDLSMIFQVIALGFIGGVLSGFIGIGGAFFITPGMMNLGIPGVIAVGSNLTHKFGKAIMGSKKHSEMGHVDKKLGMFILITALIGIKLAFWINETLFHLRKGGHDIKSGAAAGDLYISAVFVLILSLVSLALLGDVVRKRVTGEGPSTKLAELFSKVKIPPMISFPVAEVRLSFWTIALVGFFNGYLTGTIGAGGLIGVPAMIYIFGVPTAVAAGTQLFLAVFMGAWGAFNYAMGGFVDLRLVFLLYLGSLTGIYIGAYGTKVCKERMIRLITGAIILLCVISRAIDIPVYLHQLGYISSTDQTDELLNTLSKYVLFAGGFSAMLVILVLVFKSYVRRHKVQAFLTKINAASEK